MAKSNAQTKIIYLTAGAGGMFCGSCMHDNALATALQGAGWDVQLAFVLTESTLVLTTYSLVASTSICNRRFRCSVICRLRLIVSSTVPNLSAA